jgi:RNA polymerase sigma-70 factor (ECF subfamily)
MADQDRHAWDRERIAQGSALVDRALRMARPGPYQIQAAISAVHCQALSFEETDWQQIAALYGELARYQPSPVVALNQAVAVGMWRGADAGLSLLDRIDGLDDNHRFHAARAEFLNVVGRPGAALAALEIAITLVGNEAERLHRERRLSAIAGEAGDPPR